MLQREHAAATIDIPTRTGAIIAHMTPRDQLQVEIRPARADDAHALEEFIEPFVEQKKLLPRTPDELDDLVRFGFVAIHDGGIVGFAALEIYSKKLAELRSLAVAEEFQGRGVGKLLVQPCFELARERNVFEVMAVTSSEAFFKSCGFDFTLPGEKKALFLQTRDEH